jgi:hypothetical protein
MARDTFFGRNMVGQAEWELRGANDGRIKAAESRLVTAESGIVQRLKMSGVGAALVSDPPPAVATNQFLIQAATVVINFSGGNGSVTWPVAFPTGVLTVLTSNGDSAAINYALFSTHTTTTSGTSIVCINSGTGVGIDGLVRVNYMAIGW